MTATMKDVRTLCPCGRWATHEVFDEIECPAPIRRLGVRSLGLFCERCAKQKVKLLGGRT